METTPLCPSCGQPLPSNAPKGLCPECLMKGAFPTGADADAPEKPPRFIPPKPEELARYFPLLEILEFIGQGGMGAVYKVRQKELDRIVALKILPPGIGADPAFAERFAREAKALAKLNHPGIVTLYEFGSSGRESAQTKSPALTPEIRHWHTLTTKAVKATLNGKTPGELPPLDVSRGTEFQQRVWEELLWIPAGETRSYGEIAKSIRKPKAVRAVGGACGANPLPLLIPCHRVLAANNRIGGFSGGLDWKRKLLATEHVPFCP